MERILVIGCPGSGKSTFSRKLNKIINIPLYHLDMMYWNKDKTTVEKNLFYENLDKVLQSDKWIIDGNYQSSMEQRIKQCDTIIFLDYSLDVCLEGIKERRGKERSDIPWVSHEDDLDFIEFIKNYNTNNKPIVLDLLKKYSNKDIYVFSNRDEADKFLNLLQNNS